MRAYDPANFVSRLQATSALVDSTNPDLSAFSVTTQAAVPTMVDLLDPLDRWVGAGTVPGDALIQAVKAPTAPFTVQGTRPPCRYPNYPHYLGGNTSQAASYACRVSQ